MNLHALRLFHVIASAGSVTRASEILNISQPAITAQIKKFEKELSFALFKPQGRGIALTDAGEELTLLAKRLFAVEQQIEQFAQDYVNGSNGSIRLAATYLPAHFLIPTWIAKFKQQYEQVEMMITTTNSSDALKQPVKCRCGYSYLWRNRRGLSRYNPDRGVISGRVMVCSRTRSSLCQSASFSIRNDEGTLRYA